MKEEELKCSINIDIIIFPCGLFEKDAHIIIVTKVLSTTKDITVLSFFIQLIVPSRKGFEVRKNFGSVNDLFDRVFQTRELRTVIELSMDSCFDDWSRRESNIELVDFSSGTTDEIRGTG
jgi:hypothetical protein